MGTGLTQLLAESTTSRALPSGWIGQGRRVGDAELVETGRRSRGARGGGDGQHPPAEVGRALAHHVDGGAVRRHHDPVGRVDRRDGQAGGDRRPGRGLAVSTGTTPRPPGRRAGWPGLSAIPETVRPAPRSSGRPTAAVDVHRDDGGPAGRQHRAPAGHHHDGVGGPLARDVDGRPGLLGDQVDGDDHVLDTDRRRGEPPGRSRRCRRGGRCRGGAGGDRLWLVVTAQPTRWRRPRSPRRPTVRRARWRWRSHRGSGVPEMGSGMAASAVSGGQLHRRHRVGARHVAHRSRPGPATGRPPVPAGVAPRGHSR